MILSIINFSSLPACQLTLLFTLMTVKSEFQGEHSDGEGSRARTRQEFPSSSPLSSQGCGCAGAAAPGLGQPVAPGGSSTPGMVPCQVSVCPFSSSMFRSRRQERGQERGLAEALPSFPIPASPRQPQRGTWRIHGPREPCYPRAMPTARPFIPSWQRRIQSKAPS